MKVRKRIVTAIMAMVMIGFGLFVMTQPKEGSLEWHKKGYRQCLDRFDGNTLTDRCRALLGKVRTQWRWQISADEGHALAEKLDEHRAALIDMGYLVERRFVMTNDTRVSHLIYLEQQRLPKESLEYAWIAGIESNAVAVIGRREDLPKWEEMIRKVDSSITGSGKE